MDASLSRIFSVLALTAVSLAALPAQAQYPDLSNSPSMESGGGGDVAVIVAVEEYLTLPDVPGARQNAEDWAVLFREGYGIEKVRMLLDQNATREEMKVFAKRAAEDVEEGGTVWFVFIGHGAPAKSGKDGLLVGADAQQKTRSLQTRSVAQKKLLSLLGKGAQSRTMFVVDACFSGRTSGGDALAKGAQPVVPVVEPEVPDNTWIFSAGKANEFAGPLPGADRPAFSYLLLGALHGWADAGDGEVSAGEAMTYVRNKMRAISGRSQTPELFGASNEVLATGISSDEPDHIDSLLAGRRTGKDAETGECHGGRVANTDTKNHCCWPGQVWLDGECTGKPDECPANRFPSDKEQTCKEIPCPRGKVRQADGVHCCWPGTAWSSSKMRCIGEPDCPDGTSAVAGSCKPDEPMAWRKEGCEDENPHSCLWLAESYSDGTHGVADVEEAYELMDLACRMGSSKACAEAYFSTSLRQANLKSRRLERAETTAQRQCERSVGAGCFQLARIARWQTGAGEREFQKLREGYLKEGCELGHPVACFELGQLKQDGESERDSNRSFELLDLACNAGVADACESIDRPEEAETIRKERCDRGDRSACFELYKRRELMEELKELCREGYARGCFDVGTRAWIVEESNEKAEKWYREGCKIGRPNHCVQAAEVALQRGHKERAQRYIKPVCGKPGGSSACFRLAQISYQESQIRSDESIRYLRQACESKTPHFGSCLRLADLYMEGKSVARDVAKARRFRAPVLNHLKEEGNVRAFMHIGALYEEGIGVQKDLEKARKWYLKAWAVATPSDKGSYAGWSKYAVWYDIMVLHPVSRIAYFYAEGLGGPQQPEDAVEIWKIACDNGNVRACNILGMKYFDGEIVDQDFEVAASFFQKGCDAGPPSHETACGNLGTLYARGKGVPQNDKKAVNLFEKGCESNNGWSCYNLAKAYENGNGVTSDEEKASKLYEKACELDQEQACEAVKD